MPNKTCFKCARDLSLSEFYRHPQMGDGHLNKCKDCTRDDVSANRAKKASDPAWVAGERARCVEKETRRQREGKVDSTKRAARRAVDAAVRSGRLVKPAACERCHRDLPVAQLQAHHHDYGKPLDVQFFCAPCHNAVEGKLKYAADPIRAVA